MLTRYFTPSTLFSRRQRLDLFVFERHRTPPSGTRPGTKTISGGARVRIGFRPENSGEGERRRIDDGGRRRVPAVCRAPLAELGRSRTRAPGRTRGAPGGAARRVPRRGGGSQAVLVCAVPAERENPPIDARTQTPAPEQIPQGSFLPAPVRDADPIGPPPPAGRGGEGERLRPLGPPRRLS